VNDEFGFDVAVDHPAADFQALLAAVCPDGIDVFFENVGWLVWQAVLPLLNTFARARCPALTLSITASRRAPSIGESFPGRPGEGG
jgi:NADPH-dependent curcumin reductase CurA